MLPNTIIPGAQKSGTSSVYYYLKEHPECLMSVPKEPSFFCNSKLVHDLEYYRKCFHLSERQSPSPKIIGEATTAYMVDPNAPIRIKTVLGTHVKFIFILRNPVERAISGYWHAYKQRDELRRLDEVFCYESVDPSEAITLEGELLKDAYFKRKIKLHRYVRRYDDPFWIFRYLSNSMYLKHIERYLEHFNENNFFFLVTEELAARPKEVFADLAEFLQINPELVPHNLGRVYNKTFIPRDEWWSRMLQAVNKYRPFQKLKLWFPIVEKAYRRAALTKKPEVSVAVKDNIGGVVNQDLEALSKIVGKDLASLWRIQNESEPNENV